MSADLRLDAHVEVLFYAYAHYPDDFPSALNQLRNEPGLEGASRSWRFDRNVARVREKDEKASRFIRALADVIRGKLTVTDLSEYSEWVR